MLSAVNEYQDLRPAIIKGLQIQRNEKRRIGISAVTEDWPSVTLTIQWE